MKMKNFGVGLLIACFAVGLVGCTGGGTDQGPVPDKIPPKSDDATRMVKPGQRPPVAAPPMGEATKNPSGNVPTKK